MSKSVELPVSLMDQLGDVNFQFGNSADFKMWPCPLRVTYSKTFFKVNITGMCEKHPQWRFILQRFQKYFPLINVYWSRANYLTSDGSHQYFTYLVFKLKTCVKALNTLVPPDVVTNIIPLFAESVAQEAQKMSFYSHFAPDAQVLIMQFTKYNPVLYEMPCIELKTLNSENPMLVSQMNDSYHPSIRSPINTNYDINAD